MISRLRLPALLIALFSFTAACTQSRGSANGDTDLFGRVKGSGAVRTEVRELPRITGIRLTTATRLSIKQGTSPQLQVKAFSNLLPLLETRVEGETLVIGYKDDVAVKNDNSEVFVTLPGGIRALAASGSGDIEMTGPFELADFAVDISGSSNVKLGEGSAGNYTVDISGSGDVEGYNFKTKNATVSISGSGDVQLYASESLNATISGSGDVHYRGAPPVVKSKIPGSGEVTPQ